MKIFIFCHLDEFLFQVPSCYPSFFQMISPLVELPEESRVFLKEENYQT